MILTAFILWCSAKSAQAKGADRLPTPSRFRPEGSKFPSYRVFREVLAQEMLAARSRVCLVTPTIEDRLIGLMMFGLTRRAVVVAARVNPRTPAARGRLERWIDELRTLGIPVIEQSLKSLNLREPTVVAIDQYVWTVDVPLSETISAPVEVDASEWTSAEVCRWAEAAQTAKAASSR